MVDDIDEVKFKGVDVVGEDIKCVGVVVYEVDFGEDINGVMV